MEDQNQNQGLSADDLDIVTGGVGNGVKGIDVIVKPGKPLNSGSQGPKSPRDPTSGQASGR